jgi:hypothetical protein
MSVLFLRSLSHYRQMTMLFAGQYSDLQKWVYCFIGYYTSLHEWVFCKTVYYFTQINMFWGAFTALHKWVCCFEMQYITFYKCVCCLAGHYAALHKWMRYCGGGKNVTWQSQKSSVIWYRNILRKLRFIATSSSGHLPRYGIRQYVVPYRYLKSERSLSSEMASVYQQKFKH